MPRAIFPKDQFQDSEGNALVGASVEIRREMDNVLATVYAAREGEETIAQPLTTDGNGQIVAYLDASPGGYRTDATLGSFVAQRRNVAVGTLAEYDWPAAAVDVVYPTGYGGIASANVRDAIVEASGFDGDQVAAIVRNWRNIGGDPETLAVATAALQALAATAGGNVSLSRAQAAVATAGFTLTSGREAVRASGSTLFVDQINGVDASAGAVPITLSGDPDTQTVFLIEVIDATNPVTLIRETPTTIREADLAATTVITTGADKGNIANGDTVTSPGAEIPGGTTVVNRDHGATTIELSAAATTSDPAVTLTFSPGKAGSINGKPYDLPLGVGLTSVVLVGGTHGVEVIAGGAILAGAPAMEGFTIAATGNTDIALAHLGRFGQVTPASGTPTYTILTEANAGFTIEPLKRIEFYWDGVATSFTFVAGAGVVLVKPSTQTRAMMANGHAALTHLGGDKWSLSGALVAV